MLAVDLAPRRLRRLVRGGALRRPRHGVRRRARRRAPALPRCRPRTPTTRCGGPSATGGGREPTWPGGPSTWPARRPCWTCPATGPARRCRRTPGRRPRSACPPAADAAVRALAAQRRHHRAGGAAGRRSASCCAGSPAGDDHVVGRDRRRPPAGRASTTWSASSSTSCRCGCAPAGASFAEQVDRRRRGELHAGDRPPGRAAGADRRARSACGRDPSRAPLVQVLFNVLNFAAAAAGAARA